MQGAASRIVTFGRDSEALSTRLVERFFRYSKIPTQSNAACQKLPSSPGQQTLANLIAAELQAMGVQDVVCDSHATVTAKIPGTVPGAPCIGFITHLDTVDVGLSPEVHPQVLRVEALKDVCLNADTDLWLRRTEHPEILQYDGQVVIFSDGTSVLGADDKAAVSVVMQLVEGILSLTDAERDGRYGDILLAFVPDEEIGLLGSKALDVKKRFNIDFGFTLDCCELGELVYENFNAAHATVHFQGVTAHPMSAKGVLVNPILMAMDFVAQFPREETPEATEGKEGYHWVTSIQGAQHEARLSINIRDFDTSSFERRKMKIHDVAKSIADKYPTAKVTATVEDVYASISSAISPGTNSTAVDLLHEAMKRVGVRAKVTPMRGGTDGAALAQLHGLVVPNFFTGAHNFHSRFEFLPIPSFVKSFEVAHMLCLLAGAIHPQGAKL